ncbi:hypothetical protein W97_02640 [Coniosporium apollinis CBS 100218]|uniref:Polyprenal reductase n=1 Tax=Coniosporium apollinis (strain CBS 100218) TaxID=1168221 RepID=R7YNG9_CONA1|nr:uncharacterized protein W97_02640 [Coniosporium apollinis CBS 100218]EON63413.1 hypothetical protein W97_02640 [Coniosporium apollinis CBS 100218]
MLPPTLDNQMDAAQALRASFLFAAAGVLLVYLLPALRGRFLAYGSRASSNSPDSKKSDERTPRAPQSQTLVSRFLDHLAIYRVPHSWFIHFYILSVVSSLFWAHQILNNGYFFNLVASFVHQRRTSMTANQVLLTWTLMLAQGMRRLYESVAFSKPSKSQMWIPHWLLGLLFYMMMNIAVWVEGVPTLLNHKPRALHDLPFLSILPLSLRTSLAVPIFLLASGIQHAAHHHLFTLPSSPNYVLPTHLVFKHVLCPHYTAECVIYLCLSVIAAPVGQPVNWTVFCGLVFVAVNLGVTSVGTREWYVARFGKERAGERKGMVPGLF